MAGTSGQILESTSVAAVFFDVDFTLIYPGPRFDGEGYRGFALRYGINIEPKRFAKAVSLASVELEQVQDDIYRPDLFIRYARRVLEEMGGRGTGLEACAREIYDEWATCQHFALYDDVQTTFEVLHTSGLRIGLISNTHRCLEAFQNHFKLKRYVTAALSSSEHGYMKPHPSIFEAALKLVKVKPTESVMVGDSFTHDIAGAQKVGMGGVLIERSGTQKLFDLREVPIIRTLDDLPDLIANL